MPGLVSRGDVGSIEKHLDAIALLGDERLALYRALCRATIPLAQHRGAINGEKARELSELLAGLR